MSNFDLVKKIVSQYSEQQPNKEKKRQTKNAPRKTTPTNQTAVLTDENQNREYVDIEDVPAFLDSYGIDYEIEDKETYTFYKFSECPFNSEHNRGENGLIEVAGKGVAFNCMHNSCQNKNIYDFLYVIGIPITPIKSEGKVEKVFNKLVLNGKLLRSKKGVVYFCFRGETVPLHSEQFKNIVVRLYSEINQEVAPTNLDSRIIGHLDSYASSAEEAEINNRIINLPNQMYYALDDKNYVHITANKCKVIDKLPDNIYFVKNDLLPQVMPDFSCKPEELPSLLAQIFNVDDEQMPLLIASIISFFRNDVNSPVLVLKGSRGSCKSSCARIIVQIVNPSRVDLISLPDKEDAVVATLSNSDLVVFDNVEKISEQISAKMCISVTNGFTKKRKLYTDNTELAICIRSNIILTCIDDVVSKSDLAERSNVIHLERVGEYRQEQEINLKVQTLLPKILGAIFNTLSIVFKTQKDVKIDKPPRMADFSFFAVAVMKVVGLDENHFLNLYSHNIQESISTCAIDDPLITCVEYLLKDKLGRVEMPSEQLLNELDKTAKKYKVSLHRYSASSLSRALNTKEADLKSIGIDFRREKIGAQRSIILSQTINDFTPQTPPLDVYDDVEIDDEAEII